MTHCVATFEEKRRAVEELVKDIKVIPKTVNKKRVPIVTITYRFNEPCSQDLLPIPALIQDYTPGRAVTKEN